MKKENTIGPTLSDRLERLQRRAAKMVLRDRGVDDPVSQLGWDRLITRRKQHLCVYVHKCILGIIPKELSIPMAKSDHAHNTRNKDLLMLPKVRTEFGRKALCFQGPKAYNELPTRTKELKCICSFKEQIRTVVS